MELTNKPLPGYEDLYYVDPNTLTINNKKTGKPLTARRKKNGYPEVHLSRKGEDEYRCIHRVLAELYIPNPNNLPEVNHKDENKNNYSLDNLEWCSTSYNQKYGTINDRRGPKISKALKGRTRNDLGKPIIVIDENGNENRYPSTAEASRKLGLKTTKIQNVLYGKRKTHHGYTFRYDD